MDEPLTRAQYEEAAAAVRARTNHRPRIGIVREQARMVLGDVEDDRARLEQAEVAFLIGRDQAEGMKAQMRALARASDLAR